MRRRSRMGFASGLAGQWRVLTPRSASFPPRLDDDWIIQLAVPYTDLNISGLFEYQDTDPSSEDRILGGYGTYFSLFGFSSQ